MASLSLGRFATASRRVCQSTNGTTTRKFSAIFSMSDQFPDLPSTTPTTAKDASSTSITTLPSGLTIVTEDASTTSTVTLHFPTAGSSSESMSQPGAALLNKCLAFKSGVASSEFYSSAALLRTLENGGAKAFAEAGRYGAYLGFTCAPEELDSLVPFLSTECTFEKWDVKDAKKSADVIVESAMSDAQTVLTESLYSAAYGPQSVLGKSFYNSSAPLSAIQSFRESTYGMNGAILSATGVSDHDAFVQSVSESFADANPGPSISGSEESTSDESSAYMGGESRIFVPSSGYTYLALGLEGPTSSSALRNVIKYCLSLSDGTSIGFTAPGLVGIYTASPASSASTLLDSVSTVLDPSYFTEELVARAKQLAKAEALFTLESGNSLSLSNAMAASVLETGSFGVSHTAEMYDGITHADVMSAMTVALKSNPSVAAVGDIMEIPYQAAIAAKLS